jgi:hypothetical protein
LSFKRQPQRHDVLVTIDAQHRYQLAIEVVVAAAAGAAGLTNPDAGAIATGLSPLAVAGLGRISEAIRLRRLSNAAETVMDAAVTFGAETEAHFIEFIEAAVSDPEHQELLARTLVIAQDTAMRDKRRALGRALAAGIEGDDARIDDELLFIRAVADIDAPHIKLLKILSEEQQPIRGSLGGSVPHGWSLAMVAAQHPEFAGALPALISTLESHALIQTTRLATPTSAVQYSVTSAGRQLLDRLTEDVSIPYQ